MPPPPPEDQIYGAKVGGQITSQGNGDILGPGGRLDRLGHLIGGEYQNAVMNGFGGFVARHLLGDDGPIGDVTRAAAGVHFKPTQDQINYAVKSARQDAQNEISNSGSSGFNPAGTAAGFVGSADPTLAIPIPGIGAVAGKIATKGLANYAAHVGVSAAAHGAYGSAADAAYQAADMVDGLQQDFDVQRNLHAAAGMAALGGGMTAVSPFIGQLFKTRNGVDTTPSENPTGLTTPLTGQGLNPAELQQYHDVLQNGNESDIHNFFNGRNTLPPSHTDIHEWVNRRDAMFVGQPFNEGAEDLTNRIVGTSDLRQPVSDHIAQQTANWKNAPEYEVINHTDDIADPAVREAAASSGANDSDALGFVGPDNKVRIFANKIDSPETLNAVLYHESLGHFGLQQKFGDRLDSTLGTLLDRNVGQFGKDVNAWMKENPGAYGGDRIRAAEEVLANQSNNGAIKPSVADALTANVRQFGRRMGMNLSYSDGEIRQIMSMAHDAVINGKGRDVRANGFKQSPAYQATDLGVHDPGTNPVKYMFSGPRAENFDPNHYLGFTPSDGVPRNEIPDDEARINHDAFHSSKLNAYQTLEGVLDHPKLYEAYPQLRVMPVKLKSLDKNIAGYYSPSSESITMNGSPESTLQRRTDLRKPILLHEVQHAIQDIEGTPGIEKGTYNLSNDEYVNSPLEKEARAVEARHDWQIGDRVQHMPKYMRRSDLAASKDYVANDLDGIYKALDHGYVPETRNWEEVRRSALEAGFKPSQIKDLADVGDLSTKLYRLQSAANMADQKLSMLHEKLGTDKWTLDDQANYMTTLADRDYLVQRVKGNRAEIARALNVSKAASSYSAATMEAVADKMREEGSGLAALAEDPIKFMKFAQQIKALMTGGNPAGAHTMIAGVNKPYWEQYLNSFHFNAMLSGLSTHVKAPIDMGTGVLRNVLEKALAVPVGAVRRGANTLVGRSSLPGVSSNELVMHTYGLAKSMMNMEVYKQMLHAVKTGEGGYVGPNGKPVHVNMMNQYGSVSNPDLGPILSLPSHLVAAQDTFFRSHEMMANMYSLAVREAKSQLPHGSFDDINVLASSIAQNPSSKLLETAKDLTNRTLLLNANRLNSFLTKARTYGPNMTPWQRVTASVVNTLAPFIRVESNSLINRVVQRSPLAFLDPHTIRVLKAGGPEADIALAKVIYGTVTLGMAWNAAGKLTGGVSSNTDKRAELLADGELPKAIHENGQYNQSSNLAMSLFPWDQHNATAQIVKSARDAFESKGATLSQKMVGLKLAFESILHSMADMSWMADASPGIDALTSNENEGPGKIARFAGDTAKTFVPNILNQTERMTDSRRDTRPDDPTDITGQMTNDVKSAIPGLANQLPVKYSVYGQPLPTGATPEGVHNWLGTGNNVKEVSDPAERELNRLAGLTKAAIVTPTQRTIKLSGFHDPVKLTTAQAEEYQMYAGQTITQAVREQQQSGAWNAMSDVERIQYIRTTQTAAKKQVREALIDRPGWLNNDQLSSLKAQLNGH